MVKKFQDHIPCSFTYKLVCVDDKFSKPIAVCKGENAAYKFMEVILKEYEFYKKVMKIHFIKNLIMTEEEQFQSNNKFWICEILIEDEKARDHCQMTGKFIGAAHGNCNINPQLTKKVPIIFHNLKGYAHEKLNG